MTNSGILEMSKNQVGLAGEFYVLAQLTHRGYVATLTLGNTKGVDILVTNPELNTLFKVEVKATHKKPRRERLFGGEEMLYIWAMSEKHESLHDDKLIYCFVHLPSPNEMPKYFIVPSKTVADYVKWQHEHWLSTRTREVNPTTMRNFRIKVSDPDGYADNWGVFAQ
jgi:hypothetical protein